jgi:glutaredoxin 3
MPAVTIYTRPFCGYCARAVSLLQRKGVAYTEIDDAAFDPQKKKEMVEKSGGRTTFPQIFIDGRHIGGCDDLMALDRVGELDKLIEVA